MLEIQGVHIRFGELHVLRGINLTIKKGEIICLLGPSGCGKTTLLRVIAGLETPQAGDVRLGGNSITRIPVHQRNFGLMFQDFALFPHLNTADNVAFGLKMQGVSRDQRTARAREILGLVGLAGFEQRDVAQLSGGERQRVALARSLAPNPRLLMLDEPLGSLDAALRERLVVELREIIKRVGLTAIYVTHDQGEAMAIADRIAVMNAGQIEQVDTPESLYKRPSSTFVAQFLRLENVFPILSRADGVVHTGVGDFAVEGEAQAILLHPDGLTLTGRGDPNALSGIVHERIFQGDSYHLKVRLGDGEVLSFKVTSTIHHLPDIGQQIAVVAAPELVVPLRASQPGEPVEQRKHGVQVR